MSVAQNETVQQYATLEDVPDDVNDCWVDGVLYHRCGAGRRYQTTSAVPSCGTLKPHSKPYYHHNNLYPVNATGTTYAMTCAECYNRDKRAKKASKTEYRNETPRDKAIVTARVETVAVMGRDFTVGWHEGATYWPVKPFVEAAGLSWPPQEQRIKNDRQLAEGITKIVIPTPGGPQAMLCLPWSSWYYFWSGTHSPKTERWRNEAAEALRLVFGGTAGEVLQEKPAAQRIVEAATRAAPRAYGALSDALRRNPQYVRELSQLIEAAEAQERDRERVKANTATALKRAEEQEAEAARIVAEAREARRNAQAEDAAAEERLRQARAQFEALITQADELSGEETQYVYFFGPPDYASRMFVDGKMGDSRNIPQRRKQLRGGKPEHDMVVKRPCDDGKDCAELIIIYLCQRGAERVGNDHFRNAPGDAVVYVMGVLERMDYATPDALVSALT